MIGGVATWKIISTGELPLLSTGCMLTWVKGTIQHAFCSQFAIESLIQPQSPSGILNRSLSAPPKLDRSMSVQEGIHDVRRLQRWRTNVQRKHNRSTSEEETDLSVNKTFLSTVAEIFFFIGSDPDKAVSRKIAICYWVRGYFELVTVAGLAHSVERLTAERKVVGSIPGTGPMLRVIK